VRTDNINRPFPKLFLTNTRSIVNKFDELCASISVFDSDIIAICETWLKPNIASSLLQIDGYLLQRCDRSDERAGGGVCLWIRKLLNPEPFILTIVTWKFILTLVLITSTTVASLFQ
jgi:hypothetical protein